MKNGMSALWVSLFALIACGGQSSDAGSQRHEVSTFTFGGGYTSRPATPEEEKRLEQFDADDEAAEPASDVDTEYGQATEALSIPQGEYGAQHVSGGPCVSQNTQSDFCGVPLDKIIKYHWSGPTTDSNFPTLNFKTILQDAVAQLASLGTSFTWQNGSSTSGEGMAFSTNTHNGYGETTVFYAVPAKQVSPGFYVAKQNLCDTRINLNVAISNGWHLQTPAVQYTRFKRLFEHEMGHCAGWTDFFDSGHQGVALMYGTSPPFTPSTFSPLEVQTMQMYQP